MSVMGPTTARNAARMAGNVLRLARVKRGWSQRQLAAAAGVAPSTVGRIESGQVQPTLPMLARLLAAAEVELRLRLADYDDHDDILDADDARLNTAQRAAQQQSLDAFTDAVRMGMAADG